MLTSVRLLVLAPAALHTVGMLHDDTGHHEPHGTMYRPQSEPQLAKILALVDKVLGPDVVGVYLHGSPVLGGLRPQSDLDVLVVSHRSTTYDEKQRLVERMPLQPGR